LAHGPASLLFHRSGLSEPAPASLQSQGLCSAFPKHHRPFLAEQIPDVRVDARLVGASLQALGHQRFEAFLTSIEADDADPDLRFVFRSRAAAVSAA